MDIQRPHQLVPTTTKAIEFESRSRGGPKPVRYPTANDRDGIATRIATEIESLPVRALEMDREVVDTARIPMSVRATTSAGVPITLPGSRSNEVLSVVGEEEGRRINVAYDPETITQFENAAEKYIGYTTGRKPNNFNFFESMPKIAVTSVEDLWFSKRELMRPGEQGRLELWVPTASEARLREVLEIVGLKAPKAVNYRGVRVLRVEAGRDEFERLALSATIAQLRPASALSNTTMLAPAGVQMAVVEAASNRVTPADADVPHTCLLDTGLGNAHPLIAASTSSRLAVAGSNVDDNDGHGTNMAGLALYHNLSGHLQSNDQLEFHTRLESVLVHSDDPMISQLLPAERLERAVSLAENNADVPRTFCFAMNAPSEASDGGFASLSCAIDKLAQDVAKPRLFCVAAGNLEGQPLLTDYQALNDITPLMTPAQAWNALTVSACTDLDSVPDTHSGVAKAGDLSPWATTAVNWDSKHRAAAKPDVVYEGGNRMSDKVSGDCANHPDLCVLTTSKDVGEPLSVTGMTSAATAAVSGLCTRVQAAYPKFWPETVRGLVIHSAEHTPVMQDRVASIVGTNARKKDKATAMLDRFGYGKVDPAKVMENAADALTLIHQASLRPARFKDEKTVVLGNMRMHPMPWPTDVLSDLTNVRAELRVTLSYFIEPNPGLSMKGDANLYPSHLLNFDVKRPDEKNDDAIARINKLMDKPQNDTEPTNWLFGQARGRGSVRHDRLYLDSAADLATMDGIMVYPKGDGGRPTKRWPMRRRVTR